MGSAPAENPEVEPDIVARYLRDHPQFLVDRPDLYRRLAPPERVHGETLADHMAAMLRAERAHAAAMAARADEVLAAGRASAGLAARVQEAVIALLRAADPVECISGEVPALLGVDAATLCIEADRRGARAMPPGTVARLLRGRAVAFRHAMTDLRLLHGEAAGLAHRDALIRIPGEGAPALLALVSRDSAALDPSQGAGALTFLGRAIAAALGR